DGQPAGALDDAGVGGRAVGDRQGLTAERDVAAGGAVEGRDGGARGGGGDVEGAGGGGGDVDLARGCEAAGAAQRPSAGVDGGEAGERAGARERGRAGALLGQVEGASCPVLHDAGERRGRGVADRQGAAGGAAVGHGAGTGERADGLVEVVERERGA